LHASDKEGETSTTTMANVNSLNKIRQGMRQKRQDIEKAQKRRISLNDYCVERGGLERVLDYKNSTRFELNLSWVEANLVRVGLSYLRVVLGFDDALIKQFVIES